MKKHMESQTQEMMKLFVMSNITPGELAKALAEQLDYGVEVKIKNGQIRVTHRSYLDGLRTANEVNVALAAA